MKADAICVGFFYWLIFVASINDHKNFLFDNQLIIQINKNIVIKLNTVY
jgi:hypothetical protein